LPDEINLRRAQAVRLVDEVAEGALQGQDFGGEGAGGFDGAGVFVAQGVEAGGRLVSIVSTDTGKFIDRMLWVDPFSDP
jgi:hypothetical protein